MPLNILGLRTVGYKVSDIAKAKVWYADILGTAPYFDEPYYAGYAVRGFELGLQPEDGAEYPKVVNVVAYWAVPDVKDAYDELLARGATPFEEPMDVGDGIIVATVFDPWGNAFGLISEPQKADEGI